MESRVRELALFNLGIDSELRGCDLVSLKVRDICHGDQVASRAVVMQHRNQRLVQFEITPATRDAVQRWIKQAGLKSDAFVFPNGQLSGVVTHTSRRPLADVGGRAHQRSVTRGGKRPDGRRGSTSLRMLHLVEETQPLFRQAMRTRPVTQHGDVAQRWVAVGCEAVGDVGHGL